MRRTMCFWLMATVAVLALASLGGSPPTPDVKVAGSMTTIEVKPWAGLQPELVFGRTQDNWHINVEFIFLTNTPAHAWLRVTNRVTARLQMWLADGTEVPATNADAVAAWHLPETTTVSNILRMAYPQSSRGLRWILAGFQTSPAGGAGYGGSFGLAEVFGPAVTNDVTLTVTPLAYKVDSNQVTARLVAFPPTTVQLLWTSRAGVPSPH